MITLLNAPAPSPMGGALQSIGMIVILFVIMYFFMIRPQQKKQKEITKFRNALTEGQEVVTIGGLHGTIRRIDEAKQTIVLRVANGVEVTFEKSAIVPNGVQAVQQ